MKMWKRFAAALLAAGMVLAMLTACGSTGPTAATWDSSRTKQYYESHGVTGDKVYLRATMTASGIQSQYIFARNEKNAYADVKLSGNEVEIFVDAENYVYMTSNGDSDWSRHKPDSNYGQVAVLMRAGYQFIIPNGKNVASITAGNTTLNDKTYFAENLKLDVNGSYINYIYYYDANGLAFVEMVGANGTFEIDELNGTPSESLLTVPQKWHDMAD